MPVRESANCAAPVAIVNTCSSTGTGSLRTSSRFGWNRTARSVPAAAYTSWPVSAYSAKVPPRTSVLRWPVFRSRTAICALSVGRLRQHLRVAAAGGHGGEPGVRVVRCEDDRVVRTPTRAARKSRVAAQRNRRPTGNRDLLDLAPLLSVKYPTHCPSGDMNGDPRVSVPRPAPSPARGRRQILRARARARRLDD